MSIGMVVFKLRKTTEFYQAFDLTKLDFVGSW